VTTDPLFRALRAGLLAASEGGDHPAPLLATQALGAEDPWIGDELSYRRTDLTHLQARARRALRSAVLTYCLTRKSDSLIFAPAEIGTTMEKDLGLGRWKLDLQTSKMSWSAELSRIIELSPVREQGLESLQERVASADQAEFVRFIGALQEGDGGRKSVFLRLRRGNRGSHRVFMTGQLVARGCAEGILLSVEDNAESDTRHRLEAMQYVAHQAATTLEGPLEAISQLVGEMEDGEAGSTGDRRVRSSLERHVATIKRVSEVLDRFSNPRSDAAPVADLAVELERFREDIERLADPYECRFEMAPNSWVAADPSQLRNAICGLLYDLKNEGPVTGQLTVKLGQGQGTSVDNRTIYLWLTVTAKSGHGESDAISPPDLAAAAALVSLCGGSLYLEQWTSEHVRVVIRFRGAEPVQERPARNDSLLILLVEDNRSLQSLLTRVLHANGGAVVTCSDGTSAQSLIDAHHDDIDVLISDLDLPGVPGNELALRFRGLHPERPVVLLTGVIRDVGKLPGDIPVLMKPFSVNEFVSVIRSVVDREKMAARGPAG